MSKLISCVISCYNEEKNLPILVDQIKSNKLDSKFQFIIVNNGSKDNSSSVIKELEKKNKEIQFVDIKEDLGWGNGIMTGLKYAECEFVGWTHGDLQYDLGTLNTVYSLYLNSKNENDLLLIKGERRSRSFVESLFTTSMGIVASLILFKKLYDINSQPNFFTRKLINNFSNPPKDLMLDLYLYNKISSLDKKKIIRFPVIQNKRLYGESSWKKNFFSNFILAYKQFIGIIKIRFLK